MRFSEEKFLVLCFFRYWSRYGGSTLEFTDAIMITVYNEKNIYTGFMAKMQKEVKHWAVGPRPTTFQLEGYLTQRGKFAYHKPNRG